jgi:ArsR family transcriptional regulator, arsenate/arsenite/antimonite-responsive transcriptional repressor
MYVGSIKLLYRLHLSIKTNMQNDPPIFFEAFFEVLSDPIRRRILSLLLVHDERCVCDLNAALDVPQPKVSRHLGVLREAGLVLARREGVWMHYRLHPEIPAWAMRVLWHMKEGMPAEVAVPDQACPACVA